MGITQRLPLGNGHKNHNTRLTAYTQRDSVLMLVAAFVMFLLQLWAAYQGERCRSKRAERNIDFLQSLFSASCGWMTFSALRTSCSMYIPQHAVQYAAAAMGMAAVCILMLLVFNKLEEKRVLRFRTAEDIVSCVGMAAGFAWERAWSAAIHSIIHDGISTGLGKGELLFESLFWMATSALMLPAWRLYILPPALDGAEVSEAAAQEAMSKEAISNGQEAFGSRRTVKGPRDEADREMLTENPT